MDISNRSVKFLQLLRKGRGFKLDAFGKIDLPPGIVEKGRILNPEVLSRRFKELLSSKKSQKLSRKVIVSLPETEAFLQVIQMPKMDPKELSKAILFEAENYIPLPMSEVYVDFEVIDPLYDHLDHQDVFLAAVPQNIVQEYLKVLEDAGFKPLAFEIESRAIFRAVIPRETAFVSTLILDLGQTRTNFCIVSGHAVRFSGSMAFSGDILEQKISQSLKVDPAKTKEIEKRYGIQDAFDAVSKLKAVETQKGLIQFTSQLISGRKLAEILAPELSAFLQEIRRYLAFYEEHSFHEHLIPLGQDALISRAADQERSSMHLEEAVVPPRPVKVSGVKKIIITGGLANLKGLKEFLQSELGLQIELANPWVNVLPAPLKSMPELEVWESQQYTTAIGLALRGISEQ